jgi:hypothetical protein
MSRTLVLTDAEYTLLRELLDSLVDASEERWVGHANCDDACAHRSLAAVELIKVRHIREVIDRAEQA